MDKSLSVCLSYLSIQISSFSFYLIYIDLHGNLYGMDCLAIGYGYICCPQQQHVDDLKKRRRRGKGEGGDEERSKKNDDELAALHTSTMVAVAGVCVASGG